MPARALHYWRMRRSWSATSGLRPRRKDDAVFRAVDDRPLDDAAVRSHLVADLAFLIPPGGIDELGIAIRQLLRIELLQAVVDRIGVAIVDRFADLAIHHALEVVALGAGPAGAGRDERYQDEGGGPNRPAPARPGRSPRRGKARPRPPRRAAPPPSR